MRHYKLINTQTSEEHLCNKITIDGFDYYVSDEKVLINNWFTSLPRGTLHKCTTIFEDNLIDNTWENREKVEIVKSDCKKVIATNNSNIDIPKVVGNCILIEKLANELTSHLTFPEERKEGIILGYNKSQETHTFSEDDMIEFAKFVYEDDGSFVDNNGYPKKQFLQLWKEQKPKIVYYE